MQAIKLYYSKFGALTITNLYYYLRYYLILDSQQKIQLYFSSQYCIISFKTIVFSKRREKLIEISLIILLDSL
jgi:hypothetical protein